MTEMEYDELSEKLRKFLAEYRSPYRSVAIGIRPEQVLLPKAMRTDSFVTANLLAEHNIAFKEELFSCLGLEKDAGLDDFAEKFGGLKIDEILERI